MGEAIITSTLKRFDQKNLFFFRRALGSSSIRYGLVLGMVLKFYTSEKKDKTKSQNVLEANFLFNCDLLHARLKSHYNA